MGVKGIVHCFLPERDLYGIIPVISALLDINNQVLPTCKGMLISECKCHYMH